MSRARELFSIPIPDKKNRDDYPAYSRSLEEQYLQTLLTNTIGNTFYADSNELLQEADQIHDAMLKKDPEFTAKALIFARNEGFMRLQPIFGLAKLSAVSQELFSKAFKKVILIPSDLQDFLTILKGQGRGQGGRAVKRQIAKFLNSISEYWAIKYNGRGRGYSLGDIVKTVHPKPATYKQKAIFGYLVGQDYDKKAVPQITAFEALKRTTDTKEQIALIQEGRLPHENREYIQSVLNDPERLAKSKILPFRFATAFYQVREIWVKDLLRQAVELTFKNLPEIPGKTAVFLDISGSMSGNYLCIGSIFAITLYKKTKGNGVFWTFNTEVYDPKPSLYDSILSQAEKIHAWGGTDTGAPVRRLLHQKRKVDNVIIITDEQQNTGSPFYEELQKYRSSINPDVKAFIIDIAPYRSSMVPPSDKNTFYIYGWSDTALQYISLTTQGYKTMVDKVREMAL